MAFQIGKRISVGLVLVIMVLIATSGIFFSSARAERSMKLDARGSNCHPGTGWMWTVGPDEPAIATQVQQELSRRGIQAMVEAQKYGEVDSCGTYHSEGIDFTIRFQGGDKSSQPDLASEIGPTLMKFGKPKLGNVKVFSPEGELIPTDFHSEIPASKEMQTEFLTAESLPGDPITKKVYVIVYDPVLSNGQKLSQYLGWNSHATITQQTVDFFKQATNNKMNYTVVQTTIVTSGWPQKVDGFVYTEDQYLAVLNGQQPAHQPDGVDYNKIVNSPTFDICGKANRGEIDEVWIYNGPAFGFYESTLVGPGAYWLNSPPVEGSHTCNRLVPIMGPSPERGVAEAVHNFTHRSESTMAKVYGSWQQNNISHNWNKFALVKAQSPNYSYSGCGTSHFPPNGTSDYDYTNPSSVLSNCNDFLNYPNLSNPLQVAKPVSCSAWGCDELQYYRYWFGHFPSFAGCGPDNVANDWWRYLANLAYALNPANACQPTKYIISGNAGAPSAILKYTDGGPKSVTANANGNYSITVPKDWSGTVTPSKPGYIFSPGNRSYTNVQNDQPGQNYTATPIYSISGNTGVAGVTLSYTYGTSRTAISQANGSYSFWVPGGWTGTVTPSHACFTFSPVNRSYNTLGGNQTGQNYTPTFKTGTGCANVLTKIGGANQGWFGLLPGASTRASFSGVNNGPVQIVSSNGVPLIAAERVIYKVNGVNTSFSEMMGLPNSELDKVYYLPWYNNIDLDTQLRLANVSGAPATVQVFIAGQQMQRSPFNLAAGASTRLSFAANNGPVKIVSTQNIVVAERVIYKVNGVHTSFSEMMGLPEKQVDTTYWLPWYNNVDLDTQLRIANVSTSPASVTVTIGGVAKPAFPLAAGASTRVSYPVNAGPVKIQSTQPIVAAERVIYKANGIPTSFTETMALPSSKLNTIHWLPWYNNVDLSTELRIGNATNAAVSVQVFIGGQQLPGSPFNVPANQSLRKTFTGISNGLVKMVSTGNIVVSEGVIYKVNNVNTSFSELLGLPHPLRNPIYWLPWYNHLHLDTQLRFGVP